MNKYKLFKNCTEKTIKIQLLTSAELLNHLLESTTDNKNKQFLLEKGTEFYRSNLNAGKKLLEKSEVIDAREIFGKVISDLNVICSKLDKVPEKITNLMSEAYAYEGKTFRFGTKEKDIALQKFKKSLELNPSYDLPKKAIESILMGRGIFPDGQFLVPEKQDKFLSSFDVPIRKI